MAHLTQLTTLRNGLRIATCEMPQAETASMGIWASVGGRHEPAALNGISHFIEHMLFKGTARRSARRIMQEIEGVGGDMNAYTAEERTCYYATAAAEFFPRVCDVLCDIYSHPRFSPVDIERERGVIGEEILMYRDEPSSHVQEILNAAWWPAHPLGRPLTGTLESIERMGREDFLAYRASHYGACNTVVSVAGRVTHEDVVQRVERGLADLPKGSRRAVKPAPAAPVKPRLHVEAREIQQTQIAMALPGPSLRDESRFALHLLHIVLGGNASSRLFQELREKRGICYSVSTHPLLLADCGVLNISVGLDRKNLGRTLALIFTQLERLKEKSVPPAELKRAKEYAVGSSRMSLERASTQSARIGGSLLAYGKIVRPEEAHERLRAVTAEEVRDVARSVLDTRRLALALVGPSPDEALLGKVIGL